MSKSSLEKAHDAILLGYFASGHSITNLIQEFILDQMEESECNDILANLLDTPEHMARCFALGKLLQHQESHQITGYVKTLNSFYAMQHPAGSEEQNNLLELQSAL